jgi:hypothetical protein
VQKQIPISNTLNLCSAIHVFNRSSVSVSCFALRPPLNRSTANRPAGPGTWRGFILAGMTKAIVRLESLPDMNTGVVMEIFCLASLR